MIKKEDIPFIVAKKRFPITGIIRKQFIFSLFMYINPAILIYIFAFEWLFKNTFSVFFYSAFIISVLLMMFLSITSFVRRLRFITISTENAEKMNLSKVKRYFENKHIPLYHLDDNCYYILSKPLNDFDAREILIFVFTDKEVMMNRMLIHSIWMRTLLIKGRQNFNDIFLDMSKFVLK